MTHRPARWLCAALLGLAGCAHELLPVGESRVVTRPVGGTVTADARRDGIAAIPEFHVVQRGDTLFSIAWRHGLDYHEVASLNGIAEPWVIQVDQKIRLRPPPARATAAKKPPAASAPPAKTRLPAGKPEKGQSSGAATSKTVPGQAIPASAPAPVVPSPAPVVAPAGPWNWPAEGRLAGRFSSGGSAPRGISIAGNAGDPVRAARDGQVVYTGNGLVGYGELVIVRHDEVYLSAYAHNRRLLVSEGDRVRAGQAIAEMGSTAADRVKLHFEIRRNGQPVDPLGLLPSRP